MWILNINKKVIVVGPSGGKVRLFLRIFLYKLVQQLQRLKVCPYLNVKRMQRTYFKRY